MKTETDPSSRCNRYTSEGRIGLDYVALSRCEMWWSVRLYEQFVEKGIRFVCVYLLPLFFVSSEVGRIDC